MKPLKLASPFIEAIAISIFISFIIHLPAIAEPKKGLVWEGIKFFSKILDKEVHYPIYVPFDYQNSTRRYPGAYLLHGYIDNDPVWVQFGEVNLIAEEAIADQLILPMIIIMPDDGTNWPINDYQNKVRYEDMFFQEFIPHIDTNYRTRAAKEFQAIAELSMKGWRTLIFVLRNPEIFAAVPAFKAACWTGEEIINLPEKVYEQIMAPLFRPGLKGQERLMEHFRSHNSLDLIKTYPMDKIKTVRFYLDCGHDDSLYRGNAALPGAMRDRQISHEFRVRDGGHPWSDWGGGFLEALKFIGQSFHR